MLRDLPEHAPGCRPEFPGIRPALRRGKSACPGDVLRLHPVKGEHFHCVQKGKARRIVLLLRNVIVAEKLFHEQRKVVSLRGCGQRLQNVLQLGIDPPLLPVHQLPVGVQDHPDVMVPDLQDMLLRRIPDALRPAFLISCVELCDDLSPSLYMNSSYRKPSSRSF